jgi:hypothetical protein
MLLISLLFLLHSSSIPSCVVTLFPYAHAVTPLCRHGLMALCIETYMMLPHVLLDPWTYFSSCMAVLIDNLQAQYASERYPGCKAVLVSLQF